MTATRLLIPWRPGLAGACVRFAASYQFEGPVPDEVRDARAGKPHEVIPSSELREPTYLGLQVRRGNDVVYYGSADATGEWLTTLGVLNGAIPGVGSALAANSHAAGEFLLRELGIGGGLVSGVPGSGPVPGWRRRAGGTEEPSPAHRRIHARPGRPQASQDTAADWETKRPPWSDCGRCIGCRENWCTSTPRTPWKRASTRVSCRRRWGWTGSTGRSAA